MYRVLIVDDEPWVVKSLEESVNWKYQGFDIIGSASDGDEALKKIEELNPNVVVTDIRMPLMDGLELIRRAKEKWPLMHFIIVTGHAEFEYAQKAVKFGACGYFLKPLDENEILDTLAKLRKMLDIQDADNYDFLHKIEECTDEKQALDICRKAEMPWDENNGMRVYCGCGLENDRFPLQKGAGLFLLYEKDVNELHQKAESIGISRNLKSPLDIPKAVLEAQIARHQDFITGKKGIYVYTSCNRSTLRKIISDISNAVNEGIWAVVSDKFNALQEQFAGMHHNILNAYYCHVRLSDIIERKGQSDEYIEPDSWRGLLELYSSFEDMIRYFKDSFLQQNEREKREPTKQIIKDLLNHLEANFCKQITLADLAGHHHINPAYLCKLFRKEMGCTITEHVTELRLKYACAMLHNSALPVTQIAQECGFSDYFYFARLFKRHYGITPSQFREGYKKQ